ncbi:hypothetical protein [Natribacillus halophilus]|uniref:Uncharacterized protein n=1 Tax=Natribacillus halophilus TaxID=549003 RepID=A0A1G8JMY4_9BACI|nr:hypothetical protein [Natribacillus halophilus]SDI32532.1 hypothetical protein SAMN04488123_101309 [Natribacillus halophilus]
MLKSGNTWMIIIPGFLMIFLFIGGWLYITGEETIDHEDLQEHVQMNADMEGEQLDAEWNWTELPDEELEGEDYMGIVAYENGDVLAGDEFAEHELQLYQDDEVIHETEATVVDEGLIFEFPNRLETNDVYGYEGSISVQLPEAADEAEVHYLHTWMNHAGQGGEDPTFADPPFPGMDDYDNFWWVESETAE